MSYLQRELAAHPLMEPRDAVKLLYQSAFGCGHLLGDADACARRVAEELAQTRADASAPVMTAIGRGLCRLELRNPTVRALGPDAIARMMRLTQERFQPSRDSFERSLDTLAALCAAGQTPFSQEALSAYLADYRAYGCPMVSHSEAYRAAYHPAYRVVLSDLGMLAPVAAELMARVQARGRAIVAIDGDCGAGKTTVAELLSSLLDASLIHMDDFFLPFERRTEERKRVPGWNVDRERFAAEVLPALLRGGRFEYRGFNCHAGEYAPRVCEDKPVVIVEGSYCHHPALDADYRELGALRVFLGVDGAEQRRRLQLRDPERFPRFLSEWMPLEKSYFMAYDIKEKADVTLQSVPWEGEA